MTRKIKLYIYILGNFVTR